MKQTELKFTEYGRKPQCDQQTFNKNMILNANLILIYSRVEAHD